jgi:hypothetical protein
MTTKPPKFARFLVKSRETWERLLRTARQSIAGGVLSGVVMAAFGEGGIAAAKAAALGAVGTIIASYIQNTAEDLGKKKDKRGAR